MPEIYDVAVIVNGVEKSLTSDPFIFIGEDGLGQSPVRRFSERGGQQHGNSDKGFLLDPRLFAIALSIVPVSGTELKTYRDNLITWFAPYNNTSLKFTLAGGSIKYIDCFFTGDLSLSAANRKHLAQNVGIQLTANDPTLYDPVAVALTFALGGGADQFVVPMVVPMKVGASDIDQTTGVNYAGNWHAKPTIRITGPITDPVITNESTNEKLDFTGITIAANDYYDIDTRYGNKSVKDKAGTSKIANLTDDSDLGTFHIAADSPDVPGGTNSIRVQGSSINASTKVEITYFTRYLGL